MSGQVDPLKQSELKEELIKRKIKTSDNKDVLVTCLKTVIATEEEHGDKDAEKDEDEDEDADEEENDDTDYR